MQGDPPAKNVVTTTDESDDDMSTDVSRCDMSEDDMMSVESVDVKSDEMMSEADADDNNTYDMTDHMDNMTTDSMPNKIQKSNDRTIRTNCSFDQLEFRDEYLKTARRTRWCGHRYLGF